jgi:hypothetical protein
MKGWTHETRHGGMGDRRRRGFVALSQSCFKFTRNDTSVLALSSFAKAMRGGYDISMAPTLKPDPASMEHLVAQYVVTNPQATAVETAEALDVDVEDVEQTGFWRRLRLSRGARELSPMPPLLGSGAVDGSSFAA